LPEAGKSVGHHNGLHVGKHMFDVALFDVARVVETHQALGEGFDLVF
jgi:hypothetical protein